MRTRDNGVVTAGPIRCGHCGQANRVPTAAAGTPRCGKCHQPLPWITDADDSTFGEIAEAARIPVILDLWAQAIPTLLVLRGGQVTARQTGAAPLPALRAWVDGALATHAP
jgi:thioredoxin 2